MDKIVGIFVFIIIFIVVLFFVVWVMLGGINGFIYGLLVLVIVLIIVCLCVLGLVIFIVIMVGIGKGVERGILIKDVESLEIVKKIDIIVFDKIGIVIEGKLKVSMVVWNNLLENVESIFYSLEKFLEYLFVEVVISYFKDIC